MMIAFNILKQMILHHWAKLLQQNKDDKVRIRKVKHLPDMVIDDNLLLDYSINELQERMNNQDFIILMISDYEDFCTNFMVAANDYSLNVYSTSAGDSIAVECLLNNRLPIWKAGGKKNYTELLLTNIEIMYDEISPCDLEEMRLNRSIQLKENHGKVAMDKSCEILNDHLILMSKSIDVDSLVNKSLFVSLARRCTCNIRPKRFCRNTNSDKHSVNIAPTRKKELQVVEKLFTHIALFTNLSRTIYDN